MKKLIVSLMTVLFLSALSGPVFAADTMPAKTPVAKSMKHKKKMKRGKKAMKPNSTPTAKK